MHTKNIIQNMESNKIAFVKDGGGTTSCFSVRLHETCRFFEVNGEWPDQIDSTQQFGMMQHPYQERVNFSSHLYGEYLKPEKSEFISFNHGWQYGWFNDYDLPALSKLALKICPTTDSINRKAEELAARSVGRASVLYRGNDKVIEVPQVSYETFYEMGLDSGQTSWLVQTDEIEFFEYWRQKFPDTIRYSELPMINHNSKSYAVGENRVEFMINFLAALKAVGSHETVLTITGNTGLWLGLFRGRIDGIYQAWGGKDGWRKY